MPSAALLAPLAPTAGRYQKASEEFTHAHRKDTEDREPVGPEEFLTYTLTFGNRGSANAPEVELQADVPANTRFIRASDGGREETSGIVTWALGTVSGGESGQRQFTVAVDAGAADGTVLFSGAEIRDTASPEANARATAATAVRSGSALAVRMTAFPDPVRPGELITYTLTVTNRGTQALTGVMLSDIVPDHTKTGENSITDGGSCAWFCFSGDEVVWSLGTLGAGESRTVEMVVEVDSEYLAPEDGTLVSNSARVKADGGKVAVTERAVVVDGG